MLLETRYQPYALSLLRFVAGLLFFEHGTAKLLGFPVVAIYSTGHLPPLALVSGLLELIGGALVLLGLFTRSAAFIVSGEMAVGYFLELYPKSVFPMLNGGDAAVLFCFVFLYLAASGGGPVSLDRLIASRRSGRAAV